MLSLCFSYCHKTVIREMGLPLSGYQAKDWKKEGFIIICSKSNYYLPSGKEPTWAGDIRDVSSIPGWRRCRGVSKSWTWLSNWTELKVLVAQSCPILWDPMNCSLPGSSVHGIPQARILQWVAFPFSRGSSPPRDGTQVSLIVGGFFTSWATREARTDMHIHEEAWAENSA